MPLNRPRHTSPVFEFRIWLRPIEMDDIEIEVWCYELEPTQEGHRSIAEWAHEHIAEAIVDHHSYFEVDPDKSWQILGKATITGYWSQTNYDDEYDEDLELVEVHKQEVPEEWFEPAKLIEFDEDIVI